ncbi:MFS transporter [Nocardia arizonensis]|uniref:MFS transporter n=1 Tax=Nocardia arizonensis TaxID=1141647 RepID=UPI0006D2BF80|nr:MFS transporter [Nocardia arizonensis]
MNPVGQNRLSSSGDSISGKSSRIAFIGLTFGAFMALLDATIVAVALPSIGGDLDASTGDLQWVVNAYTVVLSALLLGAGSSGDRFGRRRVYLAGMVLFAIASAGCAVAPGIEVLIAARAIQGGAGAVLFTGSLSLLVQAFPEEALRARMIGLNDAIGGSSIALGPVLGGVLVDQLDWRAIFVINVPIAAVAIVLIPRSLPESFDPDTRSLDLPGQLLGLGALSTLTYGMIAGGERG